jgi:hypothetical protein
MTLFELGLLLSTAGISSVGCAAVCSAVLDRIGREPVAQTVTANQARRG